MFDTIVVPLDRDVIGDRVLPVARWLADCGGLPIELLATIPPHMIGLHEACELDRRVKEHGIGPHSIHVCYGNDAARAIIGHLAERPGALLVMSSTSTGPFHQRRFASVSEQVLAGTRRPLLVVGPQVAVPDRAAPPALLVCVDGEMVDPAVRAVAAWQRTFGGLVRVVEGLPAAVSADPAASCGRGVDRMVDALAAEGIESSAALLPELASDVGNVVLVASTPALAESSRRPVLIVPPVGAQSAGVSSQVSAVQPSTS